jgi:hypothetical protein
MPTIEQWLSEYGESHKNETNKAIHWICVPVIFFSIMGLLQSIKLPFLIANQSLHVAMFVLAFVILYYFSLSKTLWIGMLVFGVVCQIICIKLEKLNFMPLWQISLILFSLAWIVQFYGHKIEGKKPSFLKDVQFLMIGPAWLMSFVYKKLHIKY